MSNNSFEQFFNKCNEEHRIPSSSEIFDELKNCGIFEGTELRKRDVANLMAVSVLIESIWELLFTGQYEDSSLPYSTVLEITGGLIYSPCFENIGVLMLKAFEKWAPGYEIKIHPDVKATKGSSCLDVIFENLKAYLEKKFKEKLDFYDKEYDNISNNTRKDLVQSMDKICPENCKALQLYTIFKSYCMIPDIQNLAVSYAAIFIGKNSSKRIAESELNIIDKVHRVSVKIKIFPEDEMLKILGVSDKEMKNK